MSSPFGMLAELTYACPLHCPYCSNPLNLAGYRDELTAEEWQRVLAEARALGALQLHLSGGEPLQRRYLPAIAACARELGLYTYLITSALGLSAPRRATEGRRAKPLGPHRRNPVLPPEDRGRPSGQGDGLAAHPQCGPAP